MNRIHCSLYIAVAIVLTSFGTSCKGLKGKGIAKPYQSVAYRPNNQSAVRVKVSLNNAAVYVMEGDRPLLVTATCGGTTANPTPLGHFKAYNRLPRKRSNTYGFHIGNGAIRPGKSSATPRGWRYVGYPMPNWVEFKAGYGFHTGYVHPIGRSHGCLRLHKNVAPKFFALVPSGTPIHIARSQPEDATIGKSIPRPTDYTDPDPPASYTISSKYFDDLEPRSPLFAN
jgi:hypothetical protein